MEPPVSEEVARARFFTIGAVRIGGVVMVLIGLLGLRGYFEYPEIAAYILIVVGLLDVFLVPLLLARKWRSPLE
jgi:hypothetical protein